MNNVPNSKANNLKLSEEEIRLIDEAFPAHRRKSLPML